MTSITSHLLEKVLRNKSDSSDIRVTSVTVSEACEKGSNFSSDIFSVSAIVQRGYKILTEHFIFKFPPSQDPLKDEKRNITNLFANESIGYCKLIPAMLQLQPNVELHPLGQSFPSYYYSVIDKSETLIVLEDLKPKGYIHSPLSALDYEHCSLVIKELASFHSLAYALKIKHPESISEFESVLKENLWTFPLPRSFYRSFSISLALAKQFTKNEKIIAAIEKWERKGLETLMAGLLQPIEPYAVICHGDMQRNNAMYKYQLVDGKEIPIDIKLLDLQFLRYALPTTDLSYFFYTSTTTEIRRNKLTDLLALYHSTFIGRLKMMNLEFPEFSSDVLARLYKQTMLYGIVCMFIFIPNMFCRKLYSNNSFGLNETDSEQYKMELSAIMNAIGNDEDVIRRHYIEPLEDIAILGYL